MGLVTGEARVGAAVGSEWREEMGVPRLPGSSVLGVREALAMVEQDVDLALSLSSSGPAGLWSTREVVERDFGIRK